MRSAGTFFADTITPCNPQKSALNSGYRRQSEAQQAPAAAVGVEVLLNIHEKRSYH